MSLCDFSALESEFSNRQHPHQVSEGHWERGTVTRGSRPSLCARSIKNFFPLVLSSFAPPFQYNYTFAVEESAAKRIRPSLPAGGAPAAQWSLHDDEDEDEDGRTHSQVFQFTFWWEYLWKWAKRRSFPTNLTITLGWLSVFISLVCLLRRVVVTRTPFKHPEFLFQQNKVCFSLLYRKIDCFYFLDKLNIKRLLRRSKQWDWTEASERRRRVLADLLDGSRSVSALPSKLLHSEFFGNKLAELTKQGSEIFAGRFGFRLWVRLYRMVSWKLFTFSKILPSCLAAKLLKPSM